MPRIKNERPVTSGLLNREHINVRNRTVGVPVISYADEIKPN